MDSYIIVCSAGLVAAALTLFSGFGLATLLTPVFAIFFPMEVAIAAVAVVHLANNLFKLALVGRNAVWRVVLMFGTPGAAAGMAGAWLLTVVSQTDVLLRYELLGQPREVSLVKLIVAALLFIFALFELLPVLERGQFSQRWLPVGGTLSGFCGGLSGFQGALRSAFLTKIGLNRDAFIGTATVCAVVVDVARLLVYGGSFYTGRFAILGHGGFAGLVSAATAAAFIGSFVGARQAEKVTIHAVRRLVGVMLLGLAIALGAGLV